MYAQDEAPDVVLDSTNRDFNASVEFPIQVKDVLLDSMKKEVKKASLFFQQNRYGESIEVLEKVLTYAIKAKKPIIEAKCYGMLGNNYYEITPDSLIFKYLFKAKDILEREKDTFNLINIYNDIGIAYLDFDDIEKSNANLNIALELARSGNRLKSMIYPLANIADNEMAYNEDYSKGIRLYLEALDLIEKTKAYQNSGLVSYIYLELSYAYHIIGDKKNHLLYYNRGVEFAKKNTHLDTLKDLYEQQSELYAEAEDFKNAYELVKEASVLKDSLNTIKEYEKAKQIQADKFLRENKEALLLVQKEKEFQDVTIKRTKRYNIIFALFIIGLLVSMYFIYKKNKQLNLAKEKAEKLSKVKSDFYSEISHELRTPLYAVIELSRLLLNENVNSKHKEYLESLNFSGNHLLSLINNVLELNKVDSGEMKIQILEFKLKNLINNITESLEFALRDSHNKIHVAYDGAIPMVLLGDSLKLSQVFINLISNAIKFTRKGNIYITAKLIAETEDKVNVFFQVRDDGLGISKEKQIKIFEAFYQEHTKSENSYKGTGLGLSIVKRILSAMGSEISIESEINEGAAFNFELEFSKSETVTSKENTDEVLLKKLADKQILIVDDNKVNQLVTKKILDQLNIKSKTVNSGHKAIDSVQNEHFDCILMDLHMPDLDGYETTSLIRDFNKEIAIIALTAASSEEVESKISSYEMNGYVMKPFLTSDFIETIYNATVKKLKTT